MRLPELIIRENIEDQQDRGKTLRVSADEIVQALLDEGWHFVSAPEWEQTETVMGTQIRASVVVDDDLLYGTQMLHPLEVDEAGRHYWSVLKHKIAYDLLQSVGKRLRITEVPE